MCKLLLCHRDHVEVALALPEGAEGDLLVEASLLTRRTLPVAALVRSIKEVEAFIKLACVAVERARSASRTVNRDNDFFLQRLRNDRKGRQGRLPRCRAHAR